MLKTKILIYVEPETAKEIKALAEEDRRSVSSWCVMVIEAHIKATKKA